MQTQTPPTTKKAPRYSVMKNDSLGFVKVNKTMVQVFLFPLKNKFFEWRKVVTSPSRSVDYCFP